MTLFNLLILLLVSIIFILVARKLPIGLFGEKTESWRPALKNFFQWLAKKFAKPPKSTVLDLSADEETAPAEPAFWEEEAVGDFTNADADKKEPDEEISPEEAMIKADDLLTRGSVILAQEIYLKLLERDQANPKILNRLGIIYLEQKDYQKARDYFLSSLSAGQNNSARQYNLALAYLGLGENGKAEETLRKAVNMDPSKQKYAELLEEIKTES